MTVFEVMEKGYTEIRKREQFTNELALVYEDGRTLVLGDKKREDEDAERTFAAGRLEYRRSTGKTDTRISLYVDRYVGEGEEAHLISLFENSYILFPNKTNISMLEVLFEQTHRCLASGKNIHPLLVYPTSSC